MIHHPACRNSRTCLPSHAKDGAPGMGCLPWVPAGEVGRLVSLAATRHCHKLTQGTEQSLHYLHLHCNIYTRTMVISQYLRVIQCWILCKYCTTVSWLDMKEKNEQKSRCWLGTLQNSALFIADVCCSGDLYVLSEYWIIPPPKGFMNFVHMFT